MDEATFQNRQVVFDETTGTIIGMKALTEEQATKGLKLPFTSMEVFHSTAYPMVPVRPDRHGYYQYRETLADYNSSGHQDGRTYLVVLRSASDLKAPAQIPSLKVEDRTVHVWGIAPDQHSDIHVVGKHWVVSDDNEILGGITAIDGDTYGRVESEVLLLLEAINGPKEG